MKRFLLSLFMFLGITLIFITCKHEPFVDPNPQPDPAISDECDPDSVYFVKEIQPLMLSSCGTTGCHDVGTQADGVLLVDYTSILEEVKPGNASDSKLYKVITDSDPEDRMPPAPYNALTSDQIALISTWINQGAENNNCEDCDGVYESYQATIEPILQNNCVGCHSGTNASGGVRLDTQNGIDNAVLNGSLLGAIKHEPGFIAMPPGGNKFDDCTIKLIETWINEEYN